MKITTDPKTGITVEQSSKISPMNWWEDNESVGLGCTLNEMLRPDSDVKLAMVQHAVRSGGVYCRRHFMESQSFKPEVTIEAVLKILCEDLGGRLAAFEAGRFPTYAFVWADGYVTFRGQPDSKDMQRQVDAILKARTEEVLVDASEGGDEEEDEEGPSSDEVDGPGEETIPKPQKLTEAEAANLAWNKRPFDLWCFATTQERLAAVEAAVKDLLEPTKVVVPKAVTQVHMLMGNPVRGYSVNQIGMEEQELVRMNYTDENLSLYDFALKEIQAKEPSGRLLLLEGPAGGGKTRLVRAMMGALKNACRVIVVPSHMIADLTGPDLIGCLINCSIPTVLILEDADYALLSRENTAKFEKEGNTKALAAVLNLSDGIIGGLIDLRVVVTTNQKINDIDEAVTRDGRMLARIHIDKLDQKASFRVIARQSGWNLERVTERLLNRPGHWSDERDDRKDYTIKFPPGAAHNYMTLAEAYAVGNALKKEV